MGNHEANPIFKNQGFRKQEPKKTKKKKEKNKRIGYQPRAQFDLHPILGMEKQFFICFHHWFVGPHIPYLQWTDYADFLGIPIYTFPFA